MHLVRQTPFSSSSCRSGVTNLLTALTELYNGDYGALRLQPHPLGVTISMGQSTLE